MRIYGSETYIPDDVMSIIIHFHSRSTVLTTKGNRCRWKEISYFGDKRIKQIAAGNDYAMFSGSNGRVYCHGGYGSNIGGVLGIGHDKDLAFNEVPTEILYFRMNGIKIKKIACGYKHTLALANDGKLYWWGSTNDVNEPGCMDHLKKYVILDIKSGECHFYCKTVDNKHWFCGRNKYGECLYDPLHAYYNMDESKKYDGKWAKQILNVFLGSYSTNIIVNIQ